MKNVGRQREIRDDAERDGDRGENEDPSHTLDENRLGLGVQGGEDCRAPIDAAGHTHLGP